jgi:predicted ATP-grasp superfamily ATP-dependent carboligase
MAVTTEPTEILKRQVVRLLDGYDGIFQVELVGEHVLDVNPRVYGSLDLATKAGVNLVGVYWDLVRGAAVDPVAPRTGVRYCWWEGEARRMVLRLRSGEAAAVRSLPAVARQFIGQLSEDPKPVLTRLRYARRSRGRGSG